MAKVQGLEVPGVLAITLGCYKDQGMYITSCPDPTALGDGRRASIVPLHGEPLWFLSDSGHREPEV